MGPAHGLDGTGQAPLVMQLLEDLVRGKVFTHKEIEKGPATTGCPLSKSLLQPLWAWKMSGKPGALIRSFAALLRDLFRAPHKQNSRFGGGVT